jgi:hypothetical protein
MSSPQTKPDGVDAKREDAFFSVESEVHDLCHMASIASMLILNVTTGAESPSMIKLKINSDEFERIQFVVAQTNAMAKELAAAYRKAFYEGART